MNKTKLKEQFKEIPYVHSVAQTKKDTIISIDNMPPLAMHNYLLIPKGSYIGIIEHIPDDEITRIFYNNKVRVYVNNHNAFYLTQFNIDDFIIIEEFEEEEEPEEEGLVL